MSDNTFPPVLPQKNIYGPITPGQMLERTAALFRENLKLFCGIVLVIVGAEIAIDEIMKAEKLIIGRPLDTVAHWAVSIVGQTLIYVVWSVVEGALFIATSARLAGAPMSAWQACEAAIEKTGKLAGIAVSIWLRILAYLMLFVLGIVAVAIAMIAIHALLTHHRMEAGVGRTFAVLGTVLTVLFLYWLWARYACSVQAALTENLGVTDAIRRAVHLSRASKGRLYILFLFVACISTGIAVVTLPSQVTHMRGGVFHPAAPNLATEAVAMLFALLRIVVAGFVFAIYGIATALCYYDLRVRKEGFGNSPAASVATPPVPVWSSAPTVPAEDFPIS